MLRGKPVISFAEPYYAKGRLFKKFTNAGNHLNELSQHLKKCANKEQSEKERRDLVRHSLEGHFKGYFRNEGSFDVNNDLHLLEAKELGRQIGVYFRSVL